MSIGLKLFSGVNGLTSFFVSDVNEVPRPPEVPSLVNEVGSNEGEAGVDDSGKLTGRLSAKAMME